MSKWGELLDRPHQCRDPIDIWQHQARGTRGFLRGWAANARWESNAKKVKILARIQELDALADAEGLTEDGWAWHYHLEDQIMQIYRTEEEYWRQRGRRD